MTKIDDLKALTKGLGGMYREFSQSYAEIKSGRSVSGLYTNDKQNVQGNPNELYVGGMCHIMSMYWVIGQAHGIGAHKSKFIEWVVPGGKSVNMEAVGALVSKTVMYKAKGPAAASRGIAKDPNFDESFFARYNIKNKQETSTGFGGIRKAIAQSKDRYFLISYGRTGSGHACAAQSTNQGGHAYFDPNYGEAMLFSKSAWERWYPEYLRISGYDPKYTSQAVYGYKAKGSD